MPSRFREEAVMRWKAIEGYEGYYEVSDAGCVRSVDRCVCDKNGKIRRYRGKDMKLTRTKGKDGNGYMVVNLRRGGASYVAFVHILVATAFISNPCGYPMVNHINGDKTDNSITNLEWTTYSYNNIHALCNNLRKPRGTPVIQMTEDGDIIDVYESATEAERITGINAKAILQCINLRSFSAGGFAWEPYRKV